MGDVGPRAVQTEELTQALAEHYGFVAGGVLPDLGGMYNLNLLIEGPRKLVVRVYRPWVTPERLTEIQRVRAFLAARGLPIQQPVPTGSGETWIRLAERVVEVEPFVEHDGWVSSTGDRLVDALPTLGRIHNMLATWDTGRAGLEAPFSVSIGREEARRQTTEGMEWLRYTQDDAGVQRFIGQASLLAERVWELERERPAFPRQLVHGDFWYHNVFFHGERIVHIADFDFMGVRERIDDIALSLFFYCTNSKETKGTPGPARMSDLRALVDAYDAGLDAPLSTEERVALPLALARAPLAFVTKMSLVAETDLRRRIRSLGLDLPWALEMLDELEPWQDAWA